MPDYSLQFIQNLPRGNVTFLFSDIVDSTRLLDALGDRYEAVIADFRQIMRAAFQAHDGHELGTEGDSFFVVFQRAADAVGTSIDAQRALLAFPWPERAPVQVRVGINTGQPHLTSAGYVGIDVHRARRICDAGHGKQILLSQATSDAIAPSLAEGTSLRDLGRHWLKGLSQPERIFQIVAPGLPADFPPLPTADPLELHFESIVRALSEARVVPMLGGDVNLCGRPSGRKWRPHASDHPPGSLELAEHLAGVFGYPASEPCDLVRVSQYAALMSGTGRLYEELHPLLDVDYRPTLLHEFFASLPGALRVKGYTPAHLLIVTANYDDALERAFQAAGEPYDLVTYLAEGQHSGRFLHWTPEGETLVIERPNEYRGLSLAQRPVILKVNGTVDRRTAAWDSYLITEDHYLRFLTRSDVASLLPVTLAARLRKSHFLFLGYSLRDWSHRVILYRLWAEQRLSYRSWAVQAQAQPIDHELWREREVDVLHVSLEDCMARLAERVRGLPPAGGGT